MTTLDREAGSAAVLALFLLLMLTVLGLSLAMITSTEMEIGANERTIQRTFYSADSGVGLAAARILVASDYSEGEFVLNNVGGAASPLVQQRLTLAPVAPLATPPCNLCEINEAGGYGSTQYVRGIVAVTAVGERTSLDGTRTIARANIASALDFQPIQVPTSAFEHLRDYTPEELAEKVRF